MSKNKSLTKLYLISPSEIIVNEFEKSLELVLKTGLVSCFQLRLKNIEDDFIDYDLTLIEYINEIVRSFKEISNKEFITNYHKYENPIKIKKSPEILYGLRNFIGNANKFSKNKIEIFLSNNENSTTLLIRDDGPGFPKDLIDKHRLGEPYIRSADKANISKYGLGLGTFIGKTLLEKKYADIIFKNSNVTNGAEVTIKWSNKNLEKI